MDDEVRCVHDRIEALALGGRHERTDGLDEVNVVECVGAAGAEVDAKLFNKMRDFQLKWS